MSAGAGGKSYERLLAEARVRLAAAGSDTAGLDARVLLEAASGLDRMALVRDGDRPAPDEVATSFAGFLDRRLAGEPVGRIVGFREFYGRRFALGPATLEPRPDTEILCAAAIELVRGGGLPGVGTEGEGLTFVDVGTGSGAIVVTLLAELACARGVATDLASDALIVAGANARAHGVSARLTMVASSYLDALGGCFPLVVSNPPYIRSGDVAGLAPEVRLHDPVLALDGGYDGLVAYRALATAGWRRVSPGGALMLEIGADQGHEVVAILEERGFERIDILDDLGGRNRVVRAFQP